MAPAASDAIPAATSTPGTRSGVVSPVRSSPSGARSIGSSTVATECSPQKDSSVCPSRGYRLPQPATYTVRKVWRTPSEPAAGHRGGHEEDAQGDEADLHEDGPPEVVPRGGLVALDDRRDQLLLVVAADGEDDPEGDHLADERPPVGALQHRGRGVDLRVREHDPRHRGHDDRHLGHGAEAGHDLGGVTGGPGPPLVA